MREATVLREIPLQPLPEIRPVREIESGRHHADDEMVVAVQSNRLADDRSITIEPAPPESIADHGFEVAVDVESRVTGEGRSDLWRDAKHAKKVSTRLDRRHAHGIVDPVGEGELRHPPAGDIVEHTREVAIIQQIDWGQPFASKVLCWIHLPQHHEPLWIAIRQWTQHDAIEQAEDGGCRTDAQA